jgi:hypothetical protein
VCCVPKSAAVAPINAGKAWSDDNLDLDDLLRERKSVSQIAEYLGRETLKVEAQTAKRFG